MPVVCSPRPPGPLPALIRPLAWAVALGLGALPACSDDGGRKDQNYGTDVGANYQLPDGTLDRTPDTVSPADGSGGKDTLDAAQGDDTAAGGTPDAAPFQDAGEAADTETGG